MQRPLATHGQNALRSRLATRSVGRKVDCRSKRQKISPLCHDGCGCVKFFFHAKKKLFRQPVDNAVGKDLTAGYAEAAIYSQFWIQVDFDVFHGI